MKNLLKKKKSIGKNLKQCSKYKIIVIGTSTGGLNALGNFLPKIPHDFPIPIVIVQHRLMNSDDFLSNHLDSKCSLRVKEAESREQINPGKIYIAPAGYHLLIERDETFALSVDSPVSYSIPSIDVLFESAANVYSNQIIGIILTGANYDGTNGLKIIKEHGGLTIAQDPKTAKSDCMPKTAINNIDIDFIVSLDEVNDLLTDLVIKGK